MVSRQIHFFGFIGGSLLILFIVLFWGKDFYNQWHNYNVSNYDIETVDSDQIVMQKSALESLAQSLDEESDYMVEKNVQEQSQKHLEKKDEKKPDLLDIDQDVQKVTLKKNSLSADEGSVSEPKKIDNAFLLAQQSIKKILTTHILLQNQAYLGEDDKKVLDKIILLLKPLKEDMKIVVEGHTQMGVAPSVSSNMAKEVSKYLKQNLPAFKIESIGYGSQYPLSGDIYDISNKRVEIILRRSGV